MLKNSLFLLFFVSSFFLLFSCKQPETVVVTENPTPPSPKTQQKDTTVTAASFKQLNIGENNLIPSLSPLFAENTSTLRTLQLVFEGLVRYNGNETIIPAVAKKWSVSSDSLTYRFILRNDVYYHDSNAFNNGIGRKLVARDVKDVFERMARINVPGHAARLFIDIKGFEPFYREQHNVLIPGERQLSGISGITTSNDSTVTFTLENRDSHFLEKLASPYAVIYPREAVTENNPSAFKPVGTGPFTFSQKQEDNHYIFARYQNYYRQDEPVLNRVDVIVQPDDSVRSEYFQQGEFHLIPQLGPAWMSSVLNADGNLNRVLANRFRLVYTSGKTHYTLNHNSDSRLNREAARFIVRHANYSSFFKGLPSKVVEFLKFPNGGSSTGFAESDTVNITFTSDPFLKSFIQTLSDTLKQEGIALQMLNIRTPVRDIELYTSTHVPLYLSDVWPENSNTLVGFSALQTAIYLDSIENLTFNSFPWWIDLRTTTLPGIDKLGR